jgi:RNA polymerase sigma-70 factor (ECF subfamily)
MRMTVSDEDMALRPNGDGQAFASLIARQYDRLFRLCFRLTGSKHEAEDLTKTSAPPCPRNYQATNGNRHHMALP